MSLSATVSEIFCGQTSWDNPIYFSSIDVGIYSFYFTKMFLKFNLHPVLSKHNMMYDVY